MIEFLNKTIDIKTLIPVNLVAGPFKYEWYRIRRKMTGNIDLTAILEYCQKNLENKYSYYIHNVRNESYLIFAFEQKRDYLELKLLHDL